jgi:hypothetical protein
MGNTKYSETEDAKKDAKEALEKDASYKGSEKERTIFGTGFHKGFEAGVKHMEEKNPEMTGLGDGS